METAAENKSENTKSENVVEMREREAARLEVELAEVCGVINAANGRLLDLVSQVLATGAWEGWGVRSASQWVAWKCGVSPAHARRLVAMASRLAELPETKAAFEAGRLSEDQVAVVCRHTPASAESSVVEFATQTTVSQLTRTLSSYAWATPPAKAAPEEEPRRVTFGFTDEGHWRLSALLPADEGAVVERALEASRHALSESEPGSRPTWADALVGMADRSAAATDSRAARDRHTVLVHVRPDDEGNPRANLHMGPALPDSLRRLLGCDGRMRVVKERAGVAVSVGRSQRIVPERTRIVVQDRDGGCRVPGCDRTRWTQVHHIQHWEDLGPTDPQNLVCLCSKHHRLHHQGGLGIAGNADDPTGLVFTDHKGRTLTGASPPTPPTGELEPIGDWTPPSGERLEAWGVYFDEGPEAVGY